MTVTSSAPAPGAPLSPLSPPAAGSRRHAGGFWVVAAVFATVMAFNTAPTPLWAVYRAEEGWSSLTITLAFAAYAVGVLVSLLAVGHVSDWVGRRRVLLPAVALEVLAAGLFLLSPSLPVLLGARLVGGLGIGMLTATATAHLAELHRHARPDDSPRRAGVVATAANLGGLGLGPVVAGVLVAVLPAPLTTTYLVFAGLLVLSLVALLLVPETVARDRSVRYRPQRVVVPAHARRRYAGAAAGVFALFMVLGLFTSLAPSVLAALGSTHAVVSGGAAASVFFAAALSQVVLGGWAPARQLRVGLVGAATGAAAVGVAVAVGVVPLLLVGGLVAGAGGGLLLKGALGAAAELAPPEQRGEAVAGVFLAGYLGITVPVVGLGLLTAVGVALTTAAIVFVAGVLLVLALAAALLRRA
ncbi:MFS transporter [Nocardioides bruguierae]|uniref:MFS transporter n=1 Tax=Nocardioides bruguierae TaxID=2945102 RepID=A0A9X2IE92_9ACTN|nr:MFS transporter [Nocardioides bruguierae]MCM0620047.1 MFS transporter [Nocardioides bruguierae]